MKEMREETTDLKKMRKQLQEMLNETIVMAKGSTDISHEVPGAMTDMIKDLAEAEEHVANCHKAEIEVEYKKKILEVMEGAEYGKDYNMRGPLGYTKMYPEYYDYQRTPNDYYPPMGYTGGNQGNNGGNWGNSGNSGNYGDMRMGYDRSASERGRTYDNYREMRRHYTADMNPENKRNMDESRDRVMEEMETMIMELWGDLNHDEKQKYMKKSQTLMSKLQAMA